jgi:hypothetical protein
MPEQPRAESFASRWRSLVQEYPWTMRAVWGIALFMVAGDVVLLVRGAGYARETARLRAGMSSVERARIDAAMQSDSNRLQVIVELARRQARGDNGLHLSVSVDSGLLSLEQEGATLRSVPADIGPDAWVRTGARDSLRITAPRGTRTVESLAGDTAVVLNGGTLIYARAAGDSSAARPGSVRLSAGDLRVLWPSLKPGQRVYFY